MTAKLVSQSDVFTLPKPASGEKVYFDSGKPKDRVTGLALRVRAAGSRRWAFYYRFAGAQRRLGIGDAGALSLADARMAARKHRVSLDGGDNPSAEKIAKRAAASLLFASVAADYLKVCQRTMRPRSLEDCARYLTDHWKPLNGLPIAAVDRSVIAARLRAIAEDRGPIAANRARSTLSAMYAWAIGEGFCETNPVVGTNKQAEGSRERVLTDQELAKIWLACPEGGYGRIVKLLMLTAQRRDEIGGLRWSELQATDDPAKALIALPPERTKNGRPHEVPLSAAALAVIKAQPSIMRRDPVFGEGENGYSGWSRSKAALDKASGVSDWTLHDLRRTAATRMADLGVQPHVIEAVLNHVSGHKAGVAGIYNRAAYAAEKRAALDLWASHLMVEIAKAQGANVRRLRGTR